MSRARATMADDRQILSDELSAAYDAMPSPVVVYMETGEFVYLNPHARADLASGAGDVDADALLRRRWQDVDPDASEAFITAFREVAEGERVVADIASAESGVTGRAYEVRLWRGPGGLVHSFHTPVGSGVLGEVALRRLITDFPFGACYVYDLDLRYVAAHGRGMEVREHEPSDLVGRRVQDVWSEDLAAQLEAPYRRALAGEESDFVIRDGDRIYRNWTSGIRNERGDVICGVVLIWDVTGEVKVQETLELIRKAIDALPLGVTLASAEPGTPLVFANEGFRDLSGWEPLEARGRDFRFLFDSEAPSNRAAVDRIAEALEEGRAGQETVYSRRRDGAEFWNRFTVSPIRAGAREITHFIGIQEDVTEQRRTGQELEMSRRLGALGQLAGGLAHDMRNVLTGTGLVIDLLTERDDLPADVLEDLRDVHGVLDRGSTITDRLLSFAREHTFERHRLDLRRFLSDRLGLLRTLLRESISVHFRATPRDVWVLGNQGQLDQVLLNVATNAENAMPKGGSLRIDLCVGRPGADLGVDLGAYGPRAAEVEAWAVVRLRDEGVGMPEEVRKRAFEPFFTTRKDDGGTGLGLASVYGVVQELDGVCWIDSTEGEGTSVYLAFPQVEPPEETHEEPGATSDVLDGLHELLAEDDDAIRRACSRFLESRGAEVTAVPDGKVGMARLESDGAEFDLVITDAVMPSVSGPALIESARTLDPNLPCVLMSGYTDALSGDGLRGVHMLEKPFTMQALSAAVEEAVNVGPQEG